MQRLATLAVRLVLLVALVLLAGMVLAEVAQVGAEALAWAIQAMARM